MFRNITELTYLEVKCLEKDFPSFQGRQAMKNISFHHVAQHWWSGSSELKWLYFPLSFTSWASVIIDSSKGLLSSVDWHLRNKEHFAKAFQNLEVGMLVLSCWLYNACLWALPFLFLLGWPLPRNHTVCLQCCPLTMSSCALFFSHLYCPKLVGCCSPSGEITPDFAQIKLIKSSHIFTCQERIKAHRFVNWMAHCWVSKMPEEEQRKSRISPLLAAVSC